MHKEIADLIQEGKISSKQGKKLSLLAPEQYRFHKTWGIGKIVAWDLNQGKVTIDFKEKRNQIMAIKLAAEKTEYLPQDDIRIQLESQSNEFKKNPEAWICNLIKSSKNNCIDEQEIASLLVPQFFTEKEHQDWWKKTKKILRDSKNIKVSRTRPIEISLPLRGIDFVNAMIVKLKEEKDLSSKAKILDEIRTSNKEVEQKESLLEILETLGEIAKKNLRLYPLEAISLLSSRLLLLNVLGEQEKGFSWSDSLKSCEEGLPRFFLKFGASERRLLCQFLPQVFPEDWLEKTFSLVKDSEEGAISDIFSLIQKQKEENTFFAEIKKQASSLSLPNGLLLWIFKQRKGVTQKIFGFELSASLLNSLENEALNQSAKSSRLKNFLFEDASCIGDMVAKADKEEIKEFVKRLSKLHNFSSLETKSLVAKVIKARPEIEKSLSLQKEKSSSDALIVSWESFEKKNQEFKNLVEKEIPKNIEEISIARSYGDLRENFEYKAAKQTQAVLNRRRQEMETEISRAQGRDFSETDTSVVNIGTVVFLQEGDNEFSYSVLGAWDGNVEKGRVSYLSKTGKALLGKKVGDVLEVNDLETGKKRKAKVIKIENFLENK